MEPINLSQAEIRDITGYKKCDAQCRALLTMNIPYRPRPDGTPVVARKAYYQALGVQPDKDEDHEVKLNFDAL